MILDPSLTLEAVLAGAVATSQPEFHVDYVLYNKEGVKTKPAPFRGALNSTTDVTLLAPPQQGFIAEVLGVSIYNKDTASVTVEVKTTDGTDRTIIKVTLATLETLHYGDGEWYSTDASGSEKTSISQIPMSPLFLAYNSANDTNQTGNGAAATVDYDTVVFDLTGGFASDTFTAPITGKYLLSASVRVAALSAAMTSRIYQIITSNGTYTNVQTWTPDASGEETQHINVIADMDAADTALVRCTISNGAGNTATIVGNAARGAGTFFSGVRVG